MQQLHRRKERPCMKPLDRENAIGKAVAAHLARPLCAAAAPTGAAPWYTSFSAISGSAVPRLPVPPNASFGPAAGLNC